MRFAQKMKMRLTARIALLALAALLLSAAFAFSALAEDSAPDAPLPEEITLEDAAEEAPASEVTGLVFPAE